MGTLFNQAIRAMGNPGNGPRRHREPLESAARQVSSRAAAAARLRRTARIAAIALEIRGVNAARKLAKRSGSISRHLAKVSRIGAIILNSLSLRRLMKRAVSADAAPTVWSRITWAGLFVSSRLPALTLLALLQALSAHAQPPPVLQRGYDANVSGAMLNESTLTTSNVVPGSFGLVSALSVDDNIMAQPLYVPGVTINQAVHNVLYVATMGDTLYAFDADTGGAPLWTLNLASLVAATPIPIAQFEYSGNRNIVGNLGILSTPVIDLSTNTLYAVASTLENNTLVYRLHAVDITSGAPRTGSGVVISGAYKGATFNSRNQWQRLSLVLAGNNVVFGFSAIELESTANLYSGWVMAYDKTSLAQTGIFATVTTGNGGGGVWQSGRPPVVDGSGYVYVFTGNGYSGTGYDGVNNFSESVLKLNPASGLSLVDWFTPSNWSSLDNADKDLASAGPMLLPGTSLLVGGGKAGLLYVLNTGGLGKNTANDSGAVQEIALSAGALRAGPVYWQRSTANGGPLLYNWGVSDQLKAFPFNGSTLATTPSAQGNVTNQIYPGGILTLSANGEAPGSGVLWATVATSPNAFNAIVPGALYAFDAGNVATQLWNSNMNAARDSFGNLAKLVPPLVANGRVYVATSSKQVAVYGLIAAAPTFTPAPGTYSSALSVTLSDTTPGASYYYTTNGTTPTTSSTPYSGAIPVSSSMTIEAIAVASGYAPSPVTSGTYTIGSSTATEVSLVSSANVDAIVNNGSAVPNGGLDNLGYAYSATLLGTTLSWNGNTYLFGPVGSADAVSSTTVSSTTVALPAGNFSALSMLATAVNSNQKGQVFTVNYSDGTSTSFTQSLSDWYTPQGYPGESKVLTMPYRLAPSGALQNLTFYLYGYSFPLNPGKTPLSLTLPKNRNVVVLAIDLTPSLPPAAAPTFTPPQGPYSSVQSVTLSDTTAGASYYYTTDGTTPTTSSTPYSGAITVSSSMTIKAIAVASGYAPSPVTTSTYTIGSSTATEVSLVSSANVDAIVNDGSAVPNGGLDNLGYAYSATLLGTTPSWNGNTYLLGPVGSADAVSSTTVSSTTVALPAGNFSALSMLATAVNSNQKGQVFTVNYSDGTSTSFTQSLSDWYTPQGYPGESKALTMPYRLAPSGALQNLTFYLYGYSFPLSPGKTPVSLTLPKNRNVVVLAVDLR
jgi:Chitobiase/beta-hexosaminidase C-terminal domain